MCIEIRVDFPRKAFCLFSNGEPIGFVFKAYKHALLAKQWLEAEYIVS